jgi:tetratricopeptide (TPR) repeat protein
MNRILMIAFAALLFAPRAAAADDAAVCTRGAPAVALAACDRAIKAGGPPQRIAVLTFGRGVANQASGLNARALADYGAAIRLKPDYTAAYFNRALLLIDDHRDAAALADLTKVTDLEPLSSSGHIFLGIVNDNLNRHDAALHEFDIGVQLAGADARSYGSRGLSHLRFDEYAAALADFNRAIAFDPNFALIVSARGAVYRYLHRPAEAERDFDRSVAIAPHNSIVLGHRCWHRAALKTRLDLAQKDCDAAIAAKPDDPDPYDTRAFLEIQQGRYDKAIADYTLALSLDPRYASSLFGRGIARRRSGDRAGGDRDIAAAQIIDPRVAHAYAVDGVRP